MKTRLLFLMLGLFGMAAHAQTPARILIQGRVTDTLNAPLPGSTVLLMSPKDSSLVSFTRTGDNGSFSLKNIKRGSYILKISYVGSMPLNKLITPTEQEAAINIGDIKLKPIAKELFEVVIKTARAPLTIRGDTVEYNASSFKVPPGSTVEDLLRKLPGVLVDQDGNVRAQGQEVKKMLVDGKKFFGSDPKLATKNLQAEAISKVQVFNDKTEQSKLTGVDDGKKEKTMNLELKEEFKKGGFGKMTVAGGSDIVPGTADQARTEIKGNYNKFDKETQFSVIGLGNNTNQTGLSFNDYQDFRGSNSFNWNDDGDFGFSTGGRFLSFGNDDDDDGSNLSIPIGGGAGRGFSNNAAGGANYNYDTKKTKISSSYYYSQTRLMLDAVRNRRNFLETGSFRNAETSSQNTFNSSHRVSFRLEKQLDSLNTLVFINNTRLNKGNAALNSLQQVFNQSNALNTKTTIANSNLNNTFGMANSLIYRLKFKKKGRSFAASASYQLNTGDGNGSQNSQSDFAQPTSANDFFRNIRQRVLTNSNRSQYKASLIFVEPFAKKYFWETFYNYNLRYDEVDRNSFDRTELTDRRNDTLSRYYKNNYLFNRVGSSLRYSFKGLNISVGGAVQSFKINGRYAPDQTSARFNTIDRTFTTVIPNASFSYDLKNNRYLNASAGVDVTVPSSRELQPVIDISNPLFISEGNPDLLPSLRRNLNLSYNFFNPGSFTNFYISLDYGYNQNQTVYGQTVDPQTFITRIKPVNISGGQSVGGYSGFGFPLKKTKATLNLNAYTSIERNFTPINNVLNQTNSANYNLSTRLDLTPVDWFTFYGNAGFGFTDTRYSVSSSQNQQIRNFNYSGDANLKLPGDFYLTTGLNYRIFRNERFGFNQRVPIWNASAYKIMGKSKRAEVRLSAFDLLNRNVGVTQFAGQNYVSEERVSTLSRYFLLSFTYNMRGVQAKMRREGWY